MAKLKFSEPEVEVITFDEKDVITLSGNSIINMGEQGEDTGTEFIFP